MSGVQPGIFGAVSHVISCYLTKEIKQISEPQRFRNHKYEQGNNLNFIILFLYNPNGPFLISLLTEILYLSLLSPILVTCPTNRSLLYNNWQKLLFRIF